MKCINLTAVVLLSIVISCHVLANESKEKGRTEIGESNSAPQKESNSIKSHQVEEDEEDILHANAAEHNIGKKQLDSKDHIPMESENLIHITPRPMKKKNKKTSIKEKTKNKKKNRKALESNHIDSLETPKKSSLKGQRKHQEKKKANEAHRKKGQKSNKKSPKARKYPKKYNPKKHNIKKNQRKGNKAEKKEKKEKNKV